MRGFTLIEILVVVVIIGVLATLATLSVGLLGDDSEIENETGRLANGIALLQEQAQLEGRDYGLRVETDSYEFLRYDAFLQQWSDVEGDPGLQPRELPAGLAFELVLEGRPVLLRKAAREETKLPQMIAWGSGEMSPFQLHLVRSGAASIALIGKPDGTMEIARHAGN